MGETAEDELLYSNSALHHPRGIILATEIVDYDTSAFNPWHEQAAKGGNASDVSSAAGQR